MNTDSLFDFFTEVQKSYGALLPKKEEGLVVFLLYQKVNDGILNKVFSHENIVESIELVNYTLGKTRKNNLPTRDNEIIHNLLNFYIIRNSKGYSLRIFAEDLCKLITAELNSRFNPSQIEKQFILFQEALRTAIHDEASMKVWYSNFFERNRNQMKKQVESLHNDVEGTIKGLNTLYASDEVDFPSKLRSMDKKVQLLSSDAKKLESAFTYSGAILDMLNEAYQDRNSYAHSSEIFQRIRKEVRTFFLELEEALSEVSFTIDKIKPQLKRLYGSFDIRELDRKLEKLVTYLFKNTRLERNEFNKEELILPLDFPAVEIPSEKTRLYFPAYYDYVGQANQSAQDFCYSQEDHDKQFEEAHAKILKNQRAVEYSSRVLAELSKVGYLKYDEELLRLLEDEGDLEIAVKTTHLILQKLAKDSQFEILIHPEFKVSSKNQNIAIWKTRLQYFNS